MLKIGAFVLVVALVYRVESAVTKATVKLSGTGNVAGIVNFTQTENGVLVEGKITGLSPGKHGFHVHALGDLSNGCVSTGSHFNPYNLKHGAPTANERHVGDLGNIEAKQDGVALISMTDKLISLTNPETCIIGRGVVVHDLVDDLGLGQNEDSGKTGNAGGRVACGVIGVLNEKSSASVASINIILGLVAALITINFCNN